MNQSQMQSIVDALFDRLNLRDPSKATVADYIKALAFDSLVTTSYRILQVLPPKEYIELLRALADGIELSDAEDDKHD